MNKEARKQIAEDCERDEAAKGVIATHRARVEASKSLNERLSYLRSLGDYTVLSLFREGIRNLTLAQWKMELERQASLHEEVNDIEKELLHRLWKPMEYVPMSPIGKPK